MRCDAADLRQLPQRMRVKILVFRQITNLDPQQIFDIPRDIVAFQNLRRTVHGIFKGPGILMKLLRQTNGHKHRNPGCNHRSIDDCTVPRNHPCPLQFLHTAQTG